MTDEVTIFAALLAGFISFFAPCVLPLIPPYFSWLLGVSQEELLKQKNLKKRLFLHSLFLVLGFAIVFTILGATASKLGQLFLRYRLVAQQIGGLLILVFGLELLGIFKIIKGFQFGFIKNLFAKLNKQTSSFLIGLTFAFAWTACFSAVLGSILVLSSFQSTMTQGLILLGFFSLGLAIPFLLTAIFIGFVIEKMESITRFFKWINMFSGLILVIFGLLFITDNYYKIVAWLSRLFLN